MIIPEWFLQIYNCLWLLAFATLLGSLITLFVIVKGKAAIYYCKMAVWPAVLILVILIIGNYIKEHAPGWRQEVTINAPKPNQNFKFWGD